jgi:photosystem II stability/assembly factor-like uncharacterized protein
LRPQCRQLRLRAAICEAPGVGTVIAVQGHKFVWRIRGGYMHTLRPQDHQPRRFAARHGVGTALLLVCAAVLNSPAARAGVNLWTSNGPSGTVVNALAVDPTQAGIVYAGTAGKGVFKSMDGGDTWQPAKAGLGDIYIDSLLTRGYPVLGTGAAGMRQQFNFPAPRMLFAASASHGVFASADSGQTWTATSAGLPSASAHILAHDQNSLTLYVSTDRGVYKSHDAGTSWTPTALLFNRDPVGEGEPSLGAWIDCLAYDQSTAALYACFFNWSNEEGPSWKLLRSSNDGATWDDVMLPGPGGPVAIAVSSTSPAPIFVVVYAPLTQVYTILKTNDGGTTWDPVGGEIPGCGASCAINDIAVDSGMPRALYAATATGVFKTFDDGTGWQPLNTGMGERTVRAVAVDAADTAVVYAATSSGVFSIVQMARCNGDCDGNGMVDVAELVAMVDIALGKKTMAACAAGDASEDGVIGVDDVVAAVNNLMMGCHENE